MSAHHEIPNKTANRSWKEQQGKCLRQFFKRIMWNGKIKANSTVDLYRRSISFENFIVWEIAARKLDFSPVGKESPCPEGVLRYFHTYVGLCHFSGIQNFEFQFFGDFQKNKYVFGYEDFVDIIWGLSQNWTIFRGHFYAF